MADHPAWTDVQEAQLIELIGLQLSASKIGLEMGKSRNSIIGKVHRQGLKLFIPARRPRDPNYVRPRRAKQARKLPSYRLSPVQELFYAEAVNLPPDWSDHMVPFMDVQEGQCRWPIGDSASPSFRFCGDQQMQHQSYCTRHCRLAYRKFTPRPTPPNYAKKMSAWEMRA